MLARFGVDADGTDPSTLLLDPPVEGTPPPGTLATRQVLASIPELDDVALGHGMVNGPPDADGRVRRVPLTVLAGERAMPGFAVELARIASGADGLSWEGDTLVMGHRRLPADSEGRLMPRPGRLPDEATWSAVEVLSGALKPGALAGKVVLVRLGADGTSDIVATPLQNEL